MEQEDLIEFDRDADGTVTAPPYLFETESGYVQFVVLQEEMEQLHSFCLLAINSTDAKVRELESNLQEFRDGGSNLIDPDIGDVTDMTIDGLRHVEIPMWRDTQRFLVRAMCLLLLAVYLEKSLRMLCRGLATEEFRPRGPSSVSKVQLYLQFLRDECGLVFQEPQEVIEVRERCRKLRNEFAHGNWEKVRGRVEHQSLRKSFAACTQLFSVVEESWLARGGDA